MTSSYHMQLFQYIGLRVCYLRHTSRLLLFDYYHFVRISYEIRKFLRICNHCDSFEKQKLLQPVYPKIVTTSNGQARVQNNSNTYFQVFSQNIFQYI